MTTPGMVFWFSIRNRSYILRAIHKDICDVISRIETLEDILEEMELFIDDCLSDLTLTIAYRIMKATYKENCRKSNAAIWFLVCLTLAWEHGQDGTGKYFVLENLFCEVFSTQHWRLGQKFARIILAWSWIYSKIIVESITDYKSIHRLYKQMLINGGKTVPRRSKRLAKNKKTKYCR